MQYRIKPHPTDDGEYSIGLPFFYDGTARMEVQQSNNGVGWERCFLVVISNDHPDYAQETTSYLEGMVDAANGEKTQ